LTIDWLVPLATKKLMKPGPAISIRSIPPAAAIRSTINCARSRGGMPDGFASISAMFEA
jgi:hypothetical protein